MKKMIQLLILALILKSSVIAQVINVQLKGSGDPVFFLPHIGCSSDMWNEVAAHFSKKYTTYQFDFAGFAGMKALDSNYTSQYVTALSKYIEEKKLTHITLFGQNYGAFVATKLMLANPGKISRIIASDFYPSLAMVLDTAMTPEKLEKILPGVDMAIVAPSAENFKKSQEYVARSMNYMDTTHIPAFVSWQMASDRKTLAGALVDQLKENLIPALCQNTVPMLVVSTWYFAKTYKNMDISEAPAAFDKMYKGTPFVTHRVTESAKDFIPNDNPIWFIEIAEKFMN
ncbi:MAG: alpha/beta hydrolase [Ferruginibacter sp.]